MTYKRKKNTRQRGSHTHGWGAKKKHRGAGHRGGRGRAGSGKRGDAKKPSFWKNTSYYGKHGFTPKNQHEKKAITFLQIDHSLDKWVSQGHAIKEDNETKIDLTALGYDKLLGSGRCTRTYNLTVRAATPKAKAKVEVAGGRIGGLQKIEEQVAVEK